MEVNLEAFMSSRRQVGGLLMHKSRLLQTVDWLDLEVADLVTGTVRKIPSQMYGSLPRME